MKVNIFAHLFHVYHGASQTHFVLLWKKSLHGLDPILFVVLHGRVYILRNKALTYIFDVKSPYAFIVKL